MRCRAPAQPLPSTLPERPAWAMTIPLPSLQGRADREGGVMGTMEGLPGSLICCPLPCQELASKEGP